MIDWPRVLACIVGEEVSLDAVPPEHRDDVARNLVEFHMRGALYRLVVAEARVFSLSISCSLTLAVVLAPLCVPLDGSFCVSFVLLCGLFASAF